jgi:Fur family peroxide stress response transcriptional regulator
MTGKRITEQMLAEFRRRCRSHGLSVTPQRVAIYRETAKSREHPRCEDIFKKVRRRFPDISLDTVYRTLSTFAEMGIVNVVEGYGEAKRYDPDTTAHHHFRCRKCNTIIDFHDKGYDGLEIPRNFRKGFEVSSIKVVLEGLCDRCA